MVSRRKLFSMILMMTVLFLLFMLTQIYRDAVNNYDTNEYAAEITLGRSDSFSAAEASGQAPEGRQVVLIGRQSGSFGNVVEQWCTYSKRYLCCFSSLRDYLSQHRVSADILCLEPESISCLEDGELLGELYDQELVMIFGGLPEAEKLKKVPKLCQVLGIEKIREDNTELTGICMYKGFLLGGEVFYQADTQEDALRQDLELQVPWYELGGMTKKYMIGLVEDESVEREDQPPILWRNTLGKTRVFAVNGEYLRDETGLGFLDAMMAESYSYFLYPVVNAQNLSVTDYPSFTSENEEALQEIYSNSHRMLLQHIIWPSLISLSEQSGFKMTCFLTPEFFYSGENELQTELLSYYLRQIREQHGEMGWSAEGMDEISVADKWSRDARFFSEAESTYCYTAAYGGNAQADEIAGLKGGEEIPEIRTLSGMREEKEPPVSFLSENITCQGITHRADRYYFSDDLKNRSLQTALGYTNILLDMRCVSWPESAQEHWENYSRIISGNIATWWKPFSCFDKTTVTESDGRVRSFLAVEYEDMREDDTIELKLKNRQGMVSFVLRTHDKRVETVLGGTFSQIEQDAWLITVQEDEVSIVLESL